MEPADAEEPEVAETAAPEDAAPAPAPAMDDSKSRVAASSEEHEMKSMLNTLKMGAQAQFEYALMDEIVKLQEALELNAQKTSIDKAEIQATKDKAQAKKQAAGDHAARMAEMEAALQSAQQEEIKKIAQRRADAEKRLADRDKESKRVAQLEARKKEEQRLLAAEMHKETMQKAMAAQRKADEEKRKRDAAKEQALRARLDHEKRLTAERNAKKAADAADKIMKAAKLRLTQTKEAKRQFHIRHEAQAQRMETLRQVQEQKARDVKEQARQKREFIERTQQQMKAREAQRRSSILHKEATKEAAMMRQFDELNRQRRQRVHESEVALAASRGRVERTMSDLQSKLSNLEDQLNERQRRLGHFDAMRLTRMQTQQFNAVRHSIERQSMQNSMDNMKQNMKNGSIQYAMPARVRGNLQTPELKQIIERADPNGTGVVSLDSLRKVLTDLSSEQKGQASSPLLGQSSGVGAYLKRIKTNLGSSASLPALTAPGSAPGANAPSARDRLMDAFRSADADGSGTISKRELYEVLEKANLGGAAHDDFIRLFKGFDTNNDGRLSFDEFSKLANAMR